MKSAVLLICSIVLVFLVSMELSVLNDVELRTKNKSLSAQQNTVERYSSMITVAKDKLQKTFALIDAEGQQKENAITPFTLFLLTGLFGFAFWGRISSANEHQS
jgi:hypothetical protein